MNDSAQENDWEERFRSGLGPAPTPDFTAWSERHAEALAGLKALPPSVPRDSVRGYLNRKTVMKTFKLIAASILVAAGITWFGSGGDRLSPAAFADEIPGVDNVQTMSWTVTYFIRASSEDGKRTWIQKERRLHTYRHPGQYRETMLDANGAVIGVHITDARAGRMLALNMREKKAQLKMPLIHYGERSPFAYVGSFIRKRQTGSELSRIKSISLQGKKELDKKQTNVVQAIIESTENRDKSRYDFMFDATSKQLVGIWQSQEPGFDYEAAAELKSPADEKWHRMTPFGALTHEIVLNPKLDPSEFSLDPPADFALEKIAAPTVTEDEMILFLEAAARFNNQDFPDSPYLAFDQDQLNAAWEKAEADRSAEANQLIKLIDKFRMRDIYRSPVQQFTDDHTVAESFHYVGSGVKLGQSDRIVCWYKLRTTNKYRAVYGDLTAKDVTEADLPLNLSK
jgi:hypothetical protein